MIHFLVLVRLCIRFFPFFLVIQVLPQFAQSLFFLLQFTLVLCAVLCSVMSDSFATLWTVALQAPLSMEFSRQEQQSGLPFPSPKDLPDPLMEPMSPALTGGFFTTQTPGKPKKQLYNSTKCLECSPNIFFSVQSFENQSSKYLEGFGRISVHILFKSEFSDFSSHLIHIFIPLTLCDSTQV